MFLISTLSVFEILRSAKCLGSVVNTVREHVIYLRDYLAVTHQTSQMSQVVHEGKKQNRVWSRSQGFESFVTAPGPGLGVHVALQSLLPHP